MASQRLKNTLAFTDLAPGASVVLPHGLKTSTLRPLAPDVIFSPNELIEVTASNTVDITVKNNGAAPLSGSILVEAWHTLERTFDGVQNVDLPVKPYIVTSDGGDAADVQFVPARTLFVSPTWSPGVDPTVYFTTIADALVQAATLAPTQTSPVAIHVYPGTYPENISLLPWVSITGTSGAFVDTIITGAITYTPTGAVTESVFLYHLLISTSLTANMTGKTGGQTGLIIFNCSVQSLNVTGRAASGATRDMVQIWNSIPGSAPVPTFNTCFVNWNACRFGGLVFNGACIFAIGGCETLPGVAVATAVNGTSTGTVTGSSVFTPWNLAPGTKVTMSGCNITAKLGVAAGATADVRGSNYNGNGNLTGLGTINRTTHTDASPLTVIGPNAVVFAVPFPDVAYNVALQLTSGPGSAAVTVTGKTGVGFTINDPVGGNKFDITVTHD
jgi:hypothetical protein